MGEVFGSNHNSNDVVIPLKKDNETDLEIASWLKRQPNVEDYIKQLLLDDMEKSKYDADFR